MVLVLIFLVLRRDFDRPNMFAVRFSSVQFGRMASVDITTF